MPAKYALSKHFQSGKADAIAGLKNWAALPDCRWKEQEKTEYRFGYQAGKRMVSYEKPTEKQAKQQLNFRQLGLLTRTQANLKQAEKDFGFYWSSRDVLYLQQAVITLQQQVDRIRANK
jgi:hypothetical protein